MTVHKGEFRMDLGTAVYLGTYRAAIKLIHGTGPGAQPNRYPPSARAGSG